MSAKTHIEVLLKKAGITINGPNDFDIVVNDERLYGRVLAGGSLALGESYMDGWWDAKRLDQFFYKIFIANLYREASFSWPALLSYLKESIINLQSPSRAFQIGQAHYDIGNDIYEAMLDRRMVYTCGYWKNAKTLDQAQEEKFDLVCRKLGLKPGDSVLDIGCGWGSFLKFACEKYGIKGVGVTVSEKQVELGRLLCKGLPIEIRLEDYRKTEGSFDHIVSLGMFEHVGTKNYRAYMQKARELLKDDGLFLLHTIGANASLFYEDPWVAKYIFPNSILPSVAEIGKSIEGLLVVEDWHNFGADYDKTLMAWFENFNKAWPKLSGVYDQRFYRMWKYYLLAFAGSFRARHLQLWQIVLTKRGVHGGYISIR
jgi:cyclopropane-fatty-acyl-phospholipid synthase